MEKEALKVYGDQLAVRINELETEIYALAGRNI